MGKRSTFERVPRDFYPTPAEAVRPLLGHLARRSVFIEPCAGNGALIEHLVAAGHRCDFASDVVPDVTASGLEIFEADATSESYCPPSGVRFITNPPWDRRFLHPIILNLSKQAPTWLLFDADWMHTRQAAPFMPLLRKVVSVGRVKWIPDSPFTGKDNCCWYLFDAHSDSPATFVGREAA